MTELQTGQVEERLRLEQAFGLFNELSERLAGAYGQLESRVAELTDELAQARQQRLTEQVQKEHLADQLGVLLEALPAAIVLVDVRDRVDRFNPAAEQLFSDLAWGRRWREIQRDAVAAEPSPGDWCLHDGRRVSVSQRPLTDRGRILVMVDMTDQRRLQERLERQDRLSAMGEMAAQLAHQVRTPLSTSVLYAGQLAKGGLSTEQRRQFSEKLLAGLRHTETLVREMLAFSRGGNFSSSPIYLTDAVTTAIAGLKPRVSQMRARLSIDLEAVEVCRLQGNLDALAGALSNLIDNALDHGGESVTVRIVATVVDELTLKLSIEDDGPGIDAQALPRIFDPFFTTRERGTGLGLAVVQAVVLEHGGNLRADASGLGGACFEIRLPLLAERVDESILPRKQVS